jgi:hypothetical protein
MELYQLHQLVTNGFVYAEVHHGMYGLPQLLPTNNCRRSLSHMATIQFLSCLVYGNMIPEILPLLLLLMTLESDIQSKKMLSIWLILFRMLAINSVKSGMVIDIVDSLYRETMRSKHVMFLCQDMLIDKICMMTTRLACNLAIESSYWRMDNNSDVGLLTDYVLYRLPIEL